VRTGWGSVYLSFLLWLVLLNIGFDSFTDDPANVTFFGLRDSLKLLLHEIVNPQAYPVRELLGSCHQMRAYWIILDMSRLILGAGQSVRTRKMLS
jgi:hypothetical protein